MQLIIENILDNIIIRKLVFSCAYFFAITLYKINQDSIRYSCIKCICWVNRVSNIFALEQLSFQFIKYNVIDSDQHENKIRKLHTNSDYMDHVRMKYSVDNKGNLDLFRDVIILKEPNKLEKGVLLLKYTPTFDAILAFYDINVLFTEYQIVLEPSWYGYCDPSILSFVSSTNNKVVVQSPDIKDFNFIKELNTNLIPIDLGSADWVDVDVFGSNPIVEKIYDIVMVANWGKHKNHNILFEALTKYKSRNLNILLIGFEWAGRTKADIYKEAKKMVDKGHKLTIYENLSASDVSMYVNQSKVLLLLTKKEGPNKGIVEGFYSNVPAILYENFIGGAKEKINPHTGILSSFENLHESIDYMLNNYQKFAPKEWALTHTGSSISTSKLNLLLKRMVLESNGVWLNDIVEKVNSPNLEYKDKLCKKSFHSHYSDLKLNQTGSKI